MQESITVLEEKLFFLCLLLAILIFIFYINKIINIKFKCYSFFTNLICIILEVCVLSTQMYILYDTFATATNMSACIIVIFSSFTIGAVQV